MMNGSEIYSLFTMDEKMLLNRIAIDESKTSCCSQLTFSMSICADDMCLSLLQSTYSKILNLSDTQWDDIQKYLPFNINITDDDFMYEESMDS